jgi:1-acyl-sn-glycerol-3-phosphate acyltransferase
MADPLRRERALELLREVSPASTRIEPSSTLGSLGVDSLAIAELAAAVERELGVDLGPVYLDERTTVDELVRSIDAGVPAAPSRRRLGAAWLQLVARVLGGRALRWWFRVRIEGAGTVPRAGSAILAMNHESALDIPLVVVATSRTITFMAKRELFRNAFLSWALGTLGAFRVDRDRFDVEAVDTALGVLERGGLLGMYPEGTRSPGQLLPFLDGAAWLALREGVPLIPCAIVGTHDVERARRPRSLEVRVRFAPAIEVGRVDDPSERRRRAVDLTAELRAAIETRLGR